MDGESGLREQQGHYGPLIIEPSRADPVACDRELAIVLSEWTVEHPHLVFSRLKMMADACNFQQCTVGDFFRDPSNERFDAAPAERLRWGDMRMNPTDSADVTGATCTYLLNGHSPAENRQSLFRPGERVLLRIINASAMTIFNVRVPELPLSGVQADGLDVQPVETDEFQIGVAETFDLLVIPLDRAYTIMAASPEPQRHEHPGAQASSGSPNSPAIERTNVRWGWRTNRTGC